MILSILICTVENRRELFSELYNHIDRMAGHFGGYTETDNGRYAEIHAHSPKIELIAIRDNKQMIIGDKRQKLLERAKGDYIVFVDDDDWLADDYIDQALKAIEQKPDCIGNLIHCDMEGKYESAIGSYKYRDWADHVDGYRYVRNIYHMSIVRRDLALKAGFRPMNHGEDYDYCMRLQKELDKVNATEVFIDKQMYFYRYKAEDHVTKYGM